MQYYVIKVSFQKKVVILKITGDTITVNTHKHCTNIICEHLKMLKLECKKHILWVHYFLNMYIQLNEMKM